MKQVLKKVSISEIDLEAHFESFRDGVIGKNHSFKSFYGEKKMLYADWIATGRLYRPIEDKITNELGPYFANTHSFSSETGKITTSVYKDARNIIKKHVNANSDDILVTTGSGMTGALSRLISILNLKNRDVKNEDDRPVVFITHMEHHSNHVSWLETHSEVVIVQPGKDLMPCPANLEQQLEKYKDRKTIIGAFTACSNVTGVITNYRTLAKVIHKYGGYCFVDFAASAPYVNIDMHPHDNEERLDAIYFSPHKFLGGPGACGILIFNNKLYHNSCPIIPGGGNVKWTNPWGAYAYFEDIEIREDGGTPGIIQTVKAALAIQLKEKLNPDLMAVRERALIDHFKNELKGIKDIKFLGNTDGQQIGCISFNIESVHYNLVVRLLNDRFGIQVRGGWSCASTYAHYLFDIDQPFSRQITKGIDTKDLGRKPGWVRVSLHPTMNLEEVKRIAEAIKEIIRHKEIWAEDYQYNPSNNEFEYLWNNKTSSHKEEFFTL